MTYTRAAFNNAVATVYSAAATLTVNSALPLGWSDTDIGGPRAATGELILSTRVYTISGAGADIWNDSDQFNFASTRRSGNGTLDRRGRFDYQYQRMGQGRRHFPQRHHRRLALRSHGGDRRGGRELPVAEHGWRVVQFRPGDGNQYPGLGGLVRDGDGSAFSGYYSSNGTTWTQVGAAQTIVMNSTVHPAVDSTLGTLVGRRTRRRACKTTTTGGIIPVWATG